MMNSVVGASGKLPGNTAARGGGFFNDGNTANITSSVISGNTATNFGGGVYNYSGALTLQNIVVSHNKANDGGGIFDAAIGSVSMTGSTVSGNAVSGPSPGGGGIDTRGMFEISSSTISGNTSTSLGGGIEALGAKAYLGIADSTIANNTANGDGGGIFVQDTKGGAVGIGNSTISGNFSTIGSGGGGIFVGGVPAAGIAVSAFSTIIANNKSGSTNAFDDVEGDPINVDHDLIRVFGSGTLNGLDATTITGVNPLLGALGNHGGPTQTMLPGAKSAAIDHGENPDGLLFDQRGFIRLLGASFDIGAVEVK